jgi:hypothetical protein
MTIKAAAPRKEVNRLSTRVRQSGLMEPMAFGIGESSEPTEEFFKEPAVPVASALDKLRQYGRPKT